LGAQPVHEPRLKPNPALALGVRLTLAYRPESVVAAMASNAAAVIEMRITAPLGFTYCEYFLRTSAASNASFAPGSSAWNMTTVTPTSAVRR
jgi:hypothetical protein